MKTKTFIAALAAVVMLGAALLLAAPQKPSTVVHVISVKWKAEATPDQIAKAVRGVETMNFPGLKNVWTRPIKKQLPAGYSTMIVMEFASEQALIDYAGSAAQKAWYEVYMPIREESRTSDVAN